MLISNALLPCFLFNLASELHFPKKGYKDFVKIAGKPNLQLGDFTVCLWMRSSETQGALFSYAVSGQDNELLIFFNRYFELTIGGTKK